MLHTDTYGNLGPYVFKNVPAGEYRVRVDYAWKTSDGAWSFATNITSAYTNGRYTPFGTWIRNSQVGCIVSNEKPWWITQPI